MINDKYREFVLCFEELDSLGIPYGLSELRQKAKELGTPILG